MILNVERGRKTNIISWREQKEGGNEGGRKGRTYHHPQVPDLDQSVLPPAQEPAAVRVESHLERKKTREGRREERMSVEKEGGERRTEGGKKRRQKQREEWREGGRAGPTLNTWLLWP